MSETADAVVIGAGVIGAAVAHELAKPGREVVVVDRLRAPGHGSTAGSCAIVRMHYSTWDGTALAWEGRHAWRDWPDHLGAAPGEALSRFVECGCLVMRTEANGHLERHMAHSRDLRIPFEEWGPGDVLRALPGADLARHGPARRMGDPGFGEPTGGRIEGAVLWPQAGYVTDPALSARNLADAAIRHGARLRLGVEVAGIETEGGRAAGVRLASGEVVHAPVVVDVAGPGSARVNAMAGVLGDMTIETRPLRQEVAHLPRPEGAYGTPGGVIPSDPDTATYSRPEGGGHILVGSEDPPCDPHRWAESDTAFERGFTEQWTTQAMRLAQRMPGLAVTAPTRGWSSSTTRRATGSPSTTAPACRASTWPAAPRGTSTRPPRRGGADGPSDRGLRGRPRPRRGPREAPAPACRPRGLAGLLLPPPTPQHGEQPLRPGVRRPASATPPGRGRRLRPCEARTTTFPGGGEHPPRSTGPVR